MLPHSTVTEPIEAVKYAQVRLDKYTPFIGGGMAVPYPVSATAICGVAPHSAGAQLNFAKNDMDELRHRAPDLECSCGFWAARDITTMGYYNRGWLIHVEFSGRVIEHEEGWRAEHQRVTSVEVPENCFYDGANCVRPARHLVLCPDFGPGLVYAACTEHVGDRIVVDPEEVEEIIGVPVVVFPRSRILRGQPTQVKTVVEVQHAGDSLEADKVIPYGLKALASNGWLCTMPYIHAWGSQSLRLDAMVNQDGVNLTLFDPFGTPIWRKTIHYQAPPK